MRAKKSYGQHFLTNELYARRIADSLQLSDQYDAVLEIGPGRGMLTKYLLEKDFKLKVVEADRDMVAYLQTHYPQLHGHIIAEDFLQVRLEHYFDGPFALIGNYPYNISSQILIRMIHYRDRIPEMVGMFQKEVADRVAAPSGDKTYGVISVLVQAFYEAENLFGVSKGNFNPPPKVQSAVIRLQRRAEPLVSPEDEKLFRKVVKMAFGQRRKMLRNTMKALLPDDDLMEDPYFEQRPERLSVEDFVQLTQRVKAASGDTEDEDTDAAADEVD